MYNYQDDEIEDLKRQLRGEPPPKEIMLPSDCFLTPQEADDLATKLLAKCLKKYMKKEKKKCG